MPSLRQGFPMYCSKSNVLKVFDRDVHPTANNALFILKWASLRPLMVKVEKSKSLGYPFDPDTNSRHHRFPWFNIVNFDRLLSPSVAFLVSCNPRTFWSISYLPIMLRCTKHHMKRGGNVVRSLQQTISRRPYLDASHNYPHDLPSADRGKPVWA